jgi:hypothetical protein
MFSEKNYLLSKSTAMHETVIGLFINRIEFGLSV